MTSKAKILYIDDEEINLSLFKYNFIDKYDVITDCCGMNGLIQLDNNPDIKVVISDMKMPKMNGLEFISEAQKKNNDKSYFILTGFDITEEIMHALDSKLIVKYFKKPFNLDEIDKAILQVI